MKQCLLLLIFLFGCKNTDTVMTVCGNFGQGKCYAVKGVTQVPYWWTDKDFEIAREHGGIGVCQFGTPVCDEKNNIIACNGEGPLPASETCDGLDNDCNNAIDEDYSLNPLKVYSGPNDVCLRNGECRKHHSICQDGEWVCTYQPMPELCDNKDNDCDGIIDEDSVEQTLCFENELWRATNGICKAGITECVNGRPKCSGQILPSLEVCDGEDNNCNGVIDDTATVLSTQYDIVFIVDTSASMCPYINAVARALSEYISQFQNNTNFRWALVNMSELGTPLIRVLSDFTDIATLQSLLINLGCEGGGDEASLDVLHDICSHTNGPFNLSWNSSANPLLFSFTDELAQTYKDPIITPDKIIDACLEHNVLPYQWSLHPDQFGPIVRDSNGLHFTMTNEWELILDNLNSVISSLCKM